MGSTPSYILLIYYICGIFMNIPYYTWDYMDYKNIYIYMDYEPLTKGDAHPSIVSIQEAETYLHDIIDDVSTTISRFPALLSMMLYDWGLLYIIIYIYSMRMDI
jgi:hypothetical protein